MAKTEYELQQEELPAPVKGCLIIPGMIGIAVFLIYVVFFYSGGHLWR